MNDCFLQTYLISVHNLTPRVFIVFSHHSQKVQHAQGKALADEYGINFFETSAKMNSNVDEAFLAIASDIVGRLRENPEHYGSE